MVPKCFVDSLEHDPHVTAALKLVPRPPDDYPAAHRKVREAEFALLRATSMRLAVDVRFLEQQTRELSERVTAARVAGWSDIATELDRSVVRSTKMLEDARALMEAVPEEAQRLATRTNRLARQRALDTFQRTLRRRIEDSQGTQEMTAEDGETMLALAAAVEADNAEYQHEVAESKRLLAEADDAKLEARSILARAMVTQVTMAAKDAVEALGVKAALYRAFPKTTPPAFLHCYNRAVACTSAASRLVGGDHPMLNGLPYNAFDSRLDDNGRALLGEFTDAWKRTALKVAAAAEG